VLCTAYFLLLLACVINAKCTDRVLIALTLLQMLCRVLAVARELTIGSAYVCNAVYTIVAEP
jgi:hypothetical protein